MKQLGRNLLLLLYGASVVVPMAWVLLSSFKSTPEIFRSPWALPAGLRFTNYTGAWNDAKIGTYFVNSLIVCVATLVILLPIGAMAAYVFAKYPFRGSKTLFATFLGGMMFPNFLVIVPLFLMLRSMGQLDTHQGLVAVYVAYSLSFTIFVLTGFFQTLPDELGEAAMLDGCTHAGTFWKVMLPLARPGMVVVGIFNAIGLWNEYNLATILLTSPEKKTLPIGIANLALAMQYEADFGRLFAALVIVTIPVLVVYWIFRDRVHESMLAGAIK